MSLESTPKILPGKNHDAWRVKEHDFSGPRDLIRWAVLAPSAHNTQPWAFDVRDTTIDVTPNLERDLTVSDPTKREMYISIGAAVTNLKVAARYFGMEPKSDTTFDESKGTFRTSIKFSNGHDRNAEDETLFHAIPARVSNGFEHSTTALPEELKVYMKSLGKNSGFDISVIEDTNKLRKIGQLVEDGSRKTLNDPAFSGELAEWVRRNKTTEFDGIPGYAYGMDDFDSRIFGPMVLSGKGTDELAKGLNKRISEETTGIGVISSELDSPEAWLEAGEQLQLIALKATSMGVSLNPLAVLIETADLYKDLMKLAETEKRPQVMFRLGIPAKEAIHTPRRLAEDVRAVGFGEERGPVSSVKPKVFSLQEGTYELHDLIRELGDVVVKDHYTDEYMYEYVSNVLHPEINNKSQEGHTQLKSMVMERDSDYDGKWVYFPWKKTIAHMPNEDEFYKILFSRNFPALSHEAQDALGELHVAVQGLSIGSLTAKALAVSGVRHMSIADPDEIAASNAPRMGGLSQLDIAENKTIKLAQALYEFNPYLDLQVFRSGVHDGNRDQFMETDIWYEHMDDLPGKIKGREHTRERLKQGKGYTITIMGTGLGHRPTVEMELPTDDTIFNGRIDQNVIDSLKESPTNFKEWVANAHQVMGLEYMPASVCQNFMNVIDGTQNFGSQLGATGMVVAGAVAWYVEMIALGKKDILPRHLVIPIEQPGTYDAQLEDEIRKVFHEKVFGPNES